MISGEVVWVGRGPLGGRDGRLALYLRDQLPLLLTPAESLGPDEPRHRHLRRHLQERGASFFRDLYTTAGGGDPQEVLDALWDLVWAGEVTNDTLAPVRAFLTGRSGSRRGRPQLPAAFPASSTGRWYLVTEVAREAPDPTMRAAAWADQLLERYGLVTRDVVTHEGAPGAMTGLYPVFTRMEETGRVRRGYFVEGLGGAQFALPGAVDRLRSPGERTAVLLAAVDPANPYGAFLPWPETASRRASRSAGAFVVLIDGHPTVFVERGGRRLSTFESDEDRLAAAAAVLPRLARRNRQFRPATIDGRPAAETLLGKLLIEQGFVDSYKGLTYRGRPGQHTT